VSLGAARRVSGVLFIEAEKDRFFGFLGWHEPAIVVPESKISEWIF